MEEPIIHIENVVKHFDKVAALRGVSLDIMRGEVVVIIGPSGSGKSTLLRCINRLEEYDEGLIVVDGIPLNSAENINTVRTEVGMVFQQFNLFPHLKVIENITLAQRIVRKRPKAEAEKQAYDLLEKVGIPDKAQAFPWQLSGGQQQRVAIARALVNNPAIILADEPTGNLDTRSAEEIMGLLHQLHDGGVTIVMVTHELDIAAHAGRVIYLIDGQIVSDKTHASGIAHLHNGENGK